MFGSNGEVVFQEFFGGIFTTEAQRAKGKSDENRGDVAGTALLV
jgi:hypothetical protein